MKKVFFVLLSAVVAVSCFAGGRRPPRPPHPPHPHHHPPYRYPDVYWGPEVETLDRAVVDDRNLVQDRFVLSEGRELKYCQFAENLDRPGAPLLILVLHGRGGSGGDNTQQLSAPAAGPFLEYVRRHRIKAVLLLPQCARDRSWVDDDVMKLVMAFLGAKMAEFHAPAEKCLVTGFSAGGEACYALCAAYPGSFARVLAVGSGGRPDLARGMRGNFYIAIGDRDRVVPPANAERMARALRDNGCRVRLELIPGRDHVDGARAAYRGAARTWFFGRSGE